MALGYWGRTVVVLIVAWFTCVSVVVPFVTFDGAGMASAVPTGSTRLGGSSSPDPAVASSSVSTRLVVDSTDRLVGKTGSRLTVSSDRAISGPPDYRPSSHLAIGTHETRANVRLAAQATGPTTTVFGQDATFGFLELSSVFFGEGSRIFGPNDVVTVSGVVPPSFRCPSSGLGIFNIPAPFPTADLYVIRNTGSYLSDGAALDDVGEKPNRVVALSSGAFVDEVVAITQPEGNLPPGEYDVVMDQCMNGVLDRSGDSVSQAELVTAQYDIVLGDGPGYAFKVLDDGTVAGNLPDIDTHPLKTSAKEMETALGGTDVEESITGGQVPIDPGFCGAMGGLSDASESDAGTFLSVLVPKCEDMAAHYAGIAADPPRSDYEEIAEVGPIDYDTRPTDTELERATQRLSNRFAEQAAITEAILITFERFQGAKAANDHDAMVRQLERLDELIDLLIGPGGNLYRTYGALEAFDRALREDPELGDTAAAAEVRHRIPELQRGIGGLVDPLGPRIRHDKTEDELIPIGLQAWITVYLGDEFLASEEGLLGIPQLREELGLPPLSLGHPTARTTGPYTSPPNRSLELDAGPSEDPDGDSLAFAWDLDSDGAFDDADGRVVDESFEKPGTRLIGVRATDPDGNADVHYTLLRIGDLTTQEVVVTNGGSSSVKTLWRVDPEGNVSVVRADAPIPGTLGGLQVDVDGDIVVAASGFGSGNTSVIQRFAANGTLVNTITEAGVEAHIGRSFDRFEDLVIDGRGDIIVVVGRSNQPHMLLRIAPDGSRASIIRDVLSTGPDPHAIHAGVDIDNRGNIIVGGGGLPDRNITEITGTGGVIVIDPDNGSASMSVPPAGYRDPDGVHHSVLPTFGGSRLFFTLGGNFHVTQVGIAVDGRGNYISGYPNHAGIRHELFRIPMPPELFVLSQDDTSVDHGIEIFPLLVSSDDTLDLVAGDIAIDRGGDVLMPGQDFSVLPTERKGVWRVTPQGTAFLMTNLTGHQTKQSRNFRPDKLGVVPEVREVTPKDVPPPPSVRITDLRVDQASCPGNVTLGVTLENTGSTPAEPPFRVEFFDGDPLADGVAVGSADVTDPIHPGESIDREVTWSDPTPGPHQVFAWAIGADANAPFTALRVCGAEGLSYPVTLSPEAATNAVGTSQTFEVTVEVLDDPVSGLPITFEVTGANPEVDTIETDESGVATFTYTGTEAGVDTVVATVASATVVRTRSSRVTWTEGANRPPTADAGGPYHVAEGETVTLNGTNSSDPDGDALSYNWSFRSRSFEGPVAAVPTVDDLEASAELLVDDGRGGSDTDSASITVTNVAPTVTAGADHVVDEGATVTLSASFTDPGVEDAPWNVTWSFGDGSDAVVLPTDARGPLQIDHVYLDDDTYDAKVCVTDKDGATGCDSMAVTVHNVAPNLTDGTTSAETIDEGDAVTVSGAFVDPGILDTHRVIVDWGDGTEETLDLPLEARSFSLNHIYLDNRPDDAPYSVTMRVVDDDGGMDNASTEVTVLNVAPDVTSVAPSNATIEEGSEIALGGTFTDPGVLDTHELTVDWGDGTDSETLALPEGDRGFSVSHRYLDNPSDDPVGRFDITVTVTDKDGGQGTNATAVQVINVAPNVSSTGDRINEGEVATTEAEFTDPGVLDTHTATVDWGDGTPPETVTVEQGAGSGNLTASHAYGDDGEYTVTVNVTDDDGAVGTANSVIEVANVAPSAELNTSDVIAFPGGEAFLGRVGVKQSHSADGVDPGSDDLTFAWDFDVDNTSSTYFNDGQNEDPPLSPGGTFPFAATDTASATFDSPGLYMVQVTVSDDDGGADEAKRSKLVTSDADGPRSMGFWHHQYSGQGRAHYDEGELSAFLDTVNFASSVYSEVRSAKSSDQADDVLSPSGPGMRGKAEAQALAAWLNFAAGGVGWTDQIDVDGDGEPDRAFHDVIAEVDSILADPDASEADLERAKDLAEAINVDGEDNNDGSGQPGGPTGDGRPG